MLLPAPGDAMVVGDNVAVTPVGAPVTDRVTAAANPFTLEVMTVSGIDPPRDKVACVPDSDSTKSGPITVRFSNCVLVIPPPEPVTFTL